MKEETLKVEKVGGNQILIMNELDQKNIDDKAQLLIKMDKTSKRRDK
jgi:hypothetical protein